LQSIAGEAANVTGGLAESDGVIAEAIESGRQQWFGSSRKLRCSVTRLTAAALSQSVAEGSFISSHFGGLSLNSAPIGETQSHVPEQEWRTPNLNKNSFREGDVRHSQADISKARKLLGYAPTHRVSEGLKEAMGWYVRSLSRQA